MAKNVKKSDLRDFVGTKFTTIKSELKNDLEEAYDSVLDPVFDKMLEPITAIKEHAIGFQGSLEGLYAHFHRSVIERNSFSENHNYQLTNFIREVSEHSNGGYSRQIRRLLRKQAVKSIENPVFKNDISPEIMEVAPKLREDTESIRQRLRDLATLETEVEAVISGAPSGKIAYEHLESLGIDLSGLPESGAGNLPVAQKFTIDVCVLNGGC